MIMRDIDDACVPIVRDYRIPKVILLSKDKAKLLYNFLSSISNSIVVIDDNLDLTINTMYGPVEVLIVKNKTNYLKVY